MKFTRSRSGYSPQEVDAVILEMQKQIADLKQRNVSLSEAIEQYDERVEQLAQNTQRLQDERVQESLRITGLMNAAVKMAEQTERDAHQRASEITRNARRDAEKIHSQTQSDLATARAALAQLRETTSSARQNNERYISDTNVRFSEIDMAIESALRDIPAAPPTGTPVSLPIAVASVSEDPYDDFVQKMRVGGHQPSYPQTGECDSALDSVGNQP